MPLTPAFWRTRLLRIVAALVQSAGIQTMSCALVHQAHDMIGHALDARVLANAATSHRSRTRQSAGIQTMSCALVHQAHDMIGHAFDARVLANAATCKSICRN